MQADPAQRYVDNILKSTPRSVDQITIEPNGQWSQTSQACGSVSSPSRGVNGRSSSDVEEELVELDDVPRLASAKSEATREPSMTRTPTAFSRNSFVSPAPPQGSSSSNKRSAGQVVDLTLSSDEEDSPPRPTKHHRTSGDPPRSSYAENIPLRTNGVNGGMPMQPTSNPFTVPNYAHRGYAPPSGS